MFSPCASRCLFIPCQHQLAHRSAMLAQHTVCVGRVHSGANVDSPGKVHYRDAAGGIK